MTQIVTSKVTKGWMSHQTNLGIESYDLNETYSPDTGIWQSKVLDLVSPKYNPQTATSPTQYWFDKSRYRNHGAISGATWVRLPSGLWCLSFDGTDYVTVGDKATLDITGILTIETWFYHTDAALDCIVHKWENNVKGWALTAAAAGGINLWLAHPGPAQVRYDSTGTLALNAWNHVLVVFDTTNVIMYFNGALDSTQAATAATIISASGALCEVGGMSIAGSAFFTGRIVLTRVYNAVVPSHFAQEKHLFGR